MEKAGIKDGFTLIFSINKDYNRENRHTRGTKALHKEPKVKINYSIKNYLAEITTPSIDKAGEGEDILEIASKRVIEIKPSATIKQLR